MTNPATDKRHESGAGEDLTPVVETSGDELLSLGVALKELGRQMMRAEAERDGDLNDEGDRVLQRG